MWAVGAKASDSILRMTIWPLTSADMRGLVITTCQMDKETFRRDGDITKHMVREEQLLFAFLGFISIIFLDRVQLTQAVWGKDKVHSSDTEKASRYGKVQHCLLWVTSNSCASSVTQFSSFQKCHRSLSQKKILQVIYIIIALMPHTLTSSL